jgi:RNA polymerase sigma factor (sigma-70 family)
MVEVIFMLLDNGGNDRKKSEEEIIEGISAKLFSKFKDETLISKGKSVFDVIQDKLVELLIRYKKPEANPKEDDVKDVENFIYRGVRKLYKNSSTLDSIDDEDNFNPKYLSRNPNAQDKLEKLQIINKVLKTCNERNQLIIALRLFDELDNTETAKRTNTSEGNVRKIICEFKKECGKFGIKV